MRGREKVKGKVSHIFTSVGPAADHGVQTISPQVIFKSYPDGRLPLVSARLASLLRKRSPDGASTD